MFLLKTKDETFTILKEWKIQIENQTDLKIKFLRTDNGLEFCNYEFDNFDKLHSIVRHRIVAYTSQQNGISYGLPKLFWG